MEAVDVAQIVTSGVAIAAFGAAVWQVRSAKDMALASIGQTERHNRQQTTHHYIARLGDAEYSKQLARSMAALALPTDGPTAKVAWREFKQLSLDEQFDISAPFNAFEEIAGLYNIGHLDHDIVERQLAHSAGVVFEHIGWWIEKTRKRDPRRFREWEAMLADLEARRAAAR